VKRRIQLPFQGLLCVKNALKVQLDGTSVHRISSN
jgi:hypothetical protein